MKMKNVLLSLTLAGLCFSQAHAQGVSHSRPAGAARHIGDGVRSIGDTNRYVATSTDERPEAFKPDQSSARQVSHNRLIAPSVSSCDTSLSCGAGRGSANRWFSAESLLWFGQKQAAPPLATTSASGVTPVAGAAGVTTQVGGPDGIDAGLLPGFRVSSGVYLGDCQKIGIGGRAYGIFSSEDTYSITSDGSTSVGIPFFNLLTSAPDAYQVAFTNGIGTLIADGSLNVRSDLDMIGAEGSAYILLGRSSDHRVDLVTGYTYNRLKNSITVASVSTDRDTGNIIPDGTIFETNDLFETENIFHGAHLGVLSSVVRNRVSLSTLAKVSFGNMRQTSAIRGFTIQTDPGGPVTTFPGGVLTQQSNIGTFTQNTFGFIPELGLKLGYCVRENLELTVGYSFLFWSTVGLAGGQIDSTVDLSQALGGAASTRPVGDFQEDSFWMQGIDLGLNYTF